MLLLAFHLEGLRVRELQLVYLFCILVSETRRRMQRVKPQLAKYVSHLFWMWT